MPGLPPTAPAHGKQPLSQELQEAQSALAWKPSEQQAGKRASSGEAEVAQPRAAKACLGRAECASSTAELQLCSEARSGRVPGVRLLCPGRALPRLASLLGFLPRKEQAARGWDKPLAPSWPQLPSCLAFAPRPQASLGRAWGQWLAHYQELQQGELRQSEEKDKCRAPPAVAWLPSLRAAWRAVGSQGTLLGSAATHTRRLTPWAPSSCLTHVGSLALSSEQRRVQVAGACPYVSGLMPRAPAQGSSP